MRSVVVTGVLAWLATNVGGASAPEASADPPVNLVVILADDLGEERDLANRHPEMVVRLREKLRAWKEAVGAQHPSLRPE